MRDGKTLKRNGELRCEGEKRLEQIPQTAGVPDGSVPCKYRLFCHDLLGADPQRHNHPAGNRLDAKLRADAAVLVRLFVGIQILRQPVALRRDR